MGAIEHLTTARTDERLVGWEAYLAAVRSHAAPNLQPPAPAPSSLRAPSSEGISHAIRSRAD